MKKPLLLAVALFVSACALQLFGGGGNTPGAEAAPASTLRVTGVTCLSANTLRVQFAWTPSGSGLQWLDLSIFNNGFAPGTFLGAGPLTPGTTTLTWDGLIANTPHYFRINTFNGSFWEPSVTAAFNTPNCAVIYSGATQLRFDVQSCLPNGLARINIDWTPSQQGAQWADFSLFNNGFFPGTFAGIGPMPPSQNTLTVDNMSPNTTYFVRVNTLTPGGWIVSATIAFTTGSCQPSPGPGFSTDPIIVNGTATGMNPAILTDVRIGAHPDEGFDRIVFEFEDELPDQTRIRYEASAVQCGSGMTEPVAGAGTIIVHMTDTRAHTEEGVSTIDDLDIPGTGSAILEAVSICDFEGIVEWAVGTPNSSRAYRVTVLQSPSRIVIEVLR